MKHCFLGAFCVALLAEVITSWLQQYRASRISGSGLYYDSLGSLVVNRLWIWIILFLLLGALWVLISRGFQRR